MDWTNLESEIAIMEKVERLKDLPIMWLPGKRPMVGQGGSFDGEVLLECCHESG
jgi:hypothetical protein